MTWPITTSRYAVDSPVSTDLFGDIITQLATTAAASSTTFTNGAPTVINGSFELNSQAGQINPTNWIYNNAGGSAGQLITAGGSFNPDHGQWSYQIQLTTNSGSPSTGQLFYGSSTSPTASNSTLDISSLNSYVLCFDYYASSSLISIPVVIYWFTATGPASVPTTTLSLATVAGTWNSERILLTPPTGATQYAFYIGATGTMVSTQNLYLDNVYCSVRPYGLSVLTSNSTSSASSYNAAQSNSAFQYFTSAIGTALNTTITIPQGIFSMDFEIYGANTLSGVSGNLGGTGRGQFPTRPGDVITITIDTHGNTVLSYNTMGNNFTIVAVNGSSSFPFSGFTYSAGTCNVSLNTAGFPSVLTMANSGPYRQGAIIFKY